MSGPEQDEYERGLRDGKMSSLTETVITLTADVRSLTKDVDKLKIAIYMLYGAIALVGILPDIKRMILGD